MANRTTVLNEAVKVGLEVYKEKFGEYPDARNPGTTGKVNGAEVEISGALMLYQALTGDGDDHVFLSATDGKASDGIVSPEEKSNSTGMELPKVAVLKTEYGYMIVDGFGNPFQYHKGGASTVNPSYDLWSFGSAKPQPKVDKEMKTDAAATAAWKKNW